MMLRFVWIVLLVKDKAIMPMKVEFYQVWSHSLSVDCAKSVTQKTIPGDALFFLLCTWLRVISFHTLENKLIVPTKSTKNVLQCMEKEGKM